MEEEDRATQPFEGQNEGAELRPKVDCEEINEEACNTPCFRLSTDPCTWLGEFRCSLI
jgi:hypothetical protein